MQEKMATIPMPILMSRHSPEVTSDTPGDQIGWSKGDAAWWTSRVSGQTCPVIIDSGIVGHERAPGDQCYEVIFTDEDNVRECVSAKQLRLR